MKVPVEPILEPVNSIDFRVLADATEYSYSEGAVDQALPDLALGFLRDARRRGQAIVPDNHHHWHGTLRKPRAHRGSSECREPDPTAADLNRLYQAVLDTYGEGHGPMDMHMLEELFQVSMIVSDADTRAAMLSGPLRILTEEVRAAGMPEHCLAPAGLPGSVLGATQPYPYGSYQRSGIRWCWWMNIMVPCSIRSRWRT